MSTAFTGCDVIVNDADQGGGGAHVASRHDRSVHELATQADR